MPGKYERSTIVGDDARDYVAFSALVYIIVGHNHACANEEHLSVSSASVHGTQSDYCKLFEIGWM